MYERERGRDSAKFYLALIIQNQGPATLSSALNHDISPLLCKDFCWGRVSRDRASKGNNMDV